MNADIRSTVFWERLRRIEGWALLAFGSLLATPWLVDRADAAIAGKPSPGLTPMEPIFGLLIGVSAWRAASGAKRPWLRGLVLVLGVVLAVSAAALGFLERRAP